MTQCDDCTDIECERHQAETAAVFAAFAARDDAKASVTTTGRDKIMTGATRQQRSGGTTMEQTTIEHKRHSAKVTQAYPFVGPIKGAKENRAAHGNVTYFEVCQCGAWRHVNANMRHREAGKWTLDS